jgi:hypothetical protein
VLAIHSLRKLPKGDLLVPDADELIERFLGQEQDMAAKRNALLMLTAHAEVCTVKQQQQQQQQEEACWRSAPGLPVTAEGTWQGPHVLTLLLLLLLLLLLCVSHVSLMCASHESDISVSRWLRGAGCAHLLPGVGRGIKPQVTLSRGGC